MVTRSGFILPEDSRPFSRNLEMQFGSAPATPMRAQGATPGQGAAPSLEEVTAQVVALGDEIQQLKLENTTLQSRVIELSGRLDRTTENKGAGQKSALRDFKHLYPEKFNPTKDSFVSWGEDFIRWIRAEDNDLADALVATADAEKPQPVPPPLAKDVRFMWLHLKKLMGDTESKAIVRTTAGDNGLESWRLLTKRYAPKTSQVRTRRLRKIVNFPKKMLTRV